MRPLTKALIAITLLVAVLLLLAWEDEPLDPGAVAVLAQESPRQTDAENGFLAVLGGIDVAAGEDPVAVGARIVAEHEAALGRGTQIDAERVDPAASRIAIEPRLRDRCRIERMNCVREAATWPVTELPEDQQLLLRRYEALGTYRHFTTIGTPDLSSPLPRVLPLTEVQRVLHAQIAQAAAAGDYAGALERIEADIRLQRRLLAETDVLLLKMVAGAMLERDLELLGQMLDAPGASAPGPDPIAPLSGAERGLRNAMLTEFRANARLLLNQLPEQNLWAMADERPESEKEGWLGGKVSRAFMAIAYKPNATTNLAWRDLVERTAEIDALPGPALAAKLCTATQPAAEPVAPRYLSWPFNPVGNILAAVGAPDHSRYRRRLFDLDGKLRLLDLEHRIRAGAVAADAIPAFLEAQPPERRDACSGEAIRFDAARGVLSFTAVGVRGDEERWRSELAL